MNDQQYAAGSCLCGDVKFRVALPSKWCAHCHCSMCRRAHGAGYVTWLGCEAKRFEVTGGEQQLQWFSSSPGAERGFCTRCGSTLFFRSEQWAGEIHITLANFDDPVDRQPQAHAYFDTRVDWLPIDDSIKIFGGS